MSEPHPRRYGMTSATEMATEIRTEEQYSSAFSSVRDEHKSETLRVALDIRKFEIDLYWKRASYFWALIAASFGGYFALSNAQRPTDAGFVVACIGFVVSLAWYLVNRGSKY